MHLVFIGTVNASYLTADGQYLYYQFGYNSGSNSRPYITIYDFTTNTVLATNNIMSDISASGNIYCYNKLIPIPNSTDIIAICVIYDSYTVYARRINLSGNVVKTYFNYTSSINGTPYGQLIDFSEEGYVTLFGGGAWANWIHAWRYDINNDIMEYAIISKQLSSISASACMNKVSSTSYTIDTGTKIYDFDIDYNSHTITTIENTLYNTNDQSAPNMLLPDIKINISNTRLPNSVSVCLCESDNSSGYDGYSILKYIPMSAISATEYQEALDTAYSIRDDATE